MPRTYAAPLPSDAVELAALVAASASSGDFALDTQVGMRNRLINGSFAIDQRLVTAPTDDVYVHDRWYVLTQTAAITVGTQSLPESGQPKCIRLTQSQAGAQRMGLAQIVESANCIDLRALAAVLSGRVRISNSQALRWAVLEWTGTADAVTSDVVADWTSTTYTASNFFIASTAVVASGTLTPGAATWTALTEITGSPTASMNNLIVFIWTDGTAAQNVTLDIGSMQLERGTQASIFERRSFGVEYRLCQRYYEKTFPLATAPAQNAGVNGAFIYLASFAGANNEFAYAQLKEEKRAAPTITFYNPSATNAQVRDISTTTDCSSTGTQTIVATSFAILATGNASTVVGSLLKVHFTADAEL